MKTTAFFFAGLFAFASAHTASTDVNVVEATRTLTAAKNATAGHARVLTAQAYQIVCNQPANAPSNWYRLNKSKGPYKCTLEPLSNKWSMLRSYRDGGVQGVHWKYTDNENDPECMENWTYHAADGRRVKTAVSGRTTTYGLNKRWCALPVYNDGGVQGYQWEYCPCHADQVGPPRPISATPEPARD